MCTFFRWDRLFLGMKLAFGFIKIPGNSSYSSYTFSHSLCSYFTAARKGMIGSLSFYFLQKFRMSLILLFCLEFEFLKRFLRHLSSLCSPCNSNISARVQKYLLLHRRTSVHVLSSWAPTPQARCSGEFHWHFYVRPDINARFSFYYRYGRAYCPLEQWSLWRAHYSSSGWQDKWIWILRAVRNRKWNPEDSEKSLLRCH